MEQEKEVIIVKDVFKSFKVPHERNSSLKSATINLIKKKSYTKFDAAKGISFSVKKGEFFGIVGRNGCGKSTMLKMLAGIYLPDKGKIQINGNLSPFLELGVGFNPELSGRDNVYLNGTILGLSRKEIDQKFDDIVEFAELGEFIDQKLKNYSSGMQVRLAFSVSIHAHAEILLIDEVLAVGDTNFQKKCFDVFRELKSEGKTIIFVTHSMNYVRDFCDRVAVFNEGEVIYLGKAEGAIDKYNKLNAENYEKTNKSSETKVERFGNGKGLIEKFSILNESGKKTSTLTSDCEFVAEAEIAFTEDVESPVFGLMIKDQSNNGLIGITTLFNSEKLGPQKAGNKITVKISDKLRLNPGSYIFKLALTDQPFESVYEELDILEEAEKINVISTKRFWGPISTSPKIEIKHK